MGSLKFNQENRPRITRRLKYGVDKFVLVKDRRLHYLEAGQGEPLLFLPSSVSVRRTWNRLAPPLSPDHRVIILEDYGTRYTNRPIGTSRQSATDQADILAQAVHQLALKKVNVVSSAGAVVLDFASRYPDLAGKLVILGGPVAPNPGKSRDSKVMENLKLSEPPLMYIYGSKPAPGGEYPVRQDIEFIQSYLPHSWIAALETGPFQSVLKDPGEIAGLIKEFLISP